ncbi:glucosamine-6-phosphate deaminase [Salinibacter ruber]|uniref:glucosamine-6-phosphate deaminase n=1 Tax=Salinibacter ruber TaxID=146919 RepID=UPI00216A7118|nr:glucosamine-6-phosphate deaminase [Salinibacter ruber]MCS3939860.1 glucosamine-6-phosphate deaminase [Salinibacter ruber]
MDSYAPPANASEQATRPDTQHERVETLIFDDPAEMAHRVARRIATLIEERQAVDQQAVLGLPTGSTPIGVYQELIRMHREDGLDFSNVVTFNLDEYYPMDPSSLQSYHRFMDENFFNHVNIPADQIHIPRGDIPPDAVERHCVEYEHEIEKAGGIDLMLLGIGRSGHVGFNEPGSGRQTRTRQVILDEITRKDAASDFFGEANVPQEAITMGVGTILDCDEIVLMATGEHKAPIVKRAVEKPPSREVTASYLQDHPNATFYLDRAAAGELTREKMPWRVREVDWTDQKAKRAVIWLSETLDTPIPRLEASDYYQNQLHSLVHRYDDVDDLAREVFEDLRQRITYRENLLSDERVLIFSPHPDDDVISMGGMFDKLVSNGNDITVSYMTNGSVAVFDADVRRYLRFIGLSSDALNMSPEDLSGFRNRREEIETFFAEKDPAEVDPSAVQTLKAHIRYGEAIAAVEVMGLDADHAEFLDMPFYKTGRVRKDPITEDDVDVVHDLLTEVEPTHIFVAGDLSDPHGTHRMCYKAIKEALRQYNDEATVPAGANGEAPTANETTRPQPLVWLYRGAWQEWPLHEADVFVPLSKADLDRKVEAIFKHESQKDRAMFPGAYDDREFWERARDRNRDTADALNGLGLPEFYAAEAFVTTYDMP